MLTGGSTSAQIQALNVGGYKERYKEFFCAIEKLYLGESLQKSTMIHMMS